jgi:hypothetical protein
VALERLERMTLVLYLPTVPEGVSFAGDDVGSIIADGPQAYPRMAFQYWPTSVKHDVKVQKPKKTAGGTSRSFGGREPKHLSLSILLTKHPLIGDYDRDVVWDRVSKTSTVERNAALKAIRIDDLSFFAAEKMLAAAQPRSGNDTLRSTTRRFFQPKENSPVTAGSNFLFAATGLLKIFGEARHPKFLLQWSRTDPFICNITKVSLDVRQVDPSWEPMVAVANISVVETTGKVSSNAAYAGYGGPAYFDTGVYRTSDGKKVTFTADVLKEIIGKNKSE